MASFEKCPNPECGKPCDLMIASASGIGCENCKRVSHVSFDALLHKRYPAKGDRMTEADAMRIKTNKKRSDGTYKPDPRWR